MVTLSVLMPHHAEIWRAFGGFFTMDSLAACRIDFWASVGLTKPAEAADGRGAGWCSELSKGSKMS